MFVKNTFSKRKLFYFGLFSCATSYYIYSISFYPDIRIIRNNTSITSLYNIHHIYIYIYSLYTHKYICLSNMYIKHNVIRSVIFPPGYIGMNIEQGKNTL